LNALTACGRVRTVDGICAPLDRALAQRLFCDAGVGIRHMEAVPFDIVQAFFDVNAGLFLTSHQLECFEGGPRSMLDRKVTTLAVAREAEYTTFASEDMDLHGHLWLAPRPYSR
jgi:hypothetical protein